MSLAKAVFSGKVYREPQLRSTSNNVPITSFSLDIGTNGEEDLIIVRALGNLAQEVEKEITKNSRVVVEGSLAIQMIKDERGAEKRMIELTMASYEKLSGNDSSAQTTTTATAAVKENDPLVTFSEPEDLIGGEEIPF